MSTTTSKTSPNAQAATYQELMAEILNLPITASRQTAKETLKESYQSLTSKAKFDLFFHNILADTIVKLQDAATAEGNTDQKKVGAPKQNQADVPQQSRAAAVCKSEPQSLTKSQDEPKKVATSRGTISRADGGEDEAAPQVKRSELKSDEVKSCVVTDDEALVVRTASNIKKENIEHNDESKLNKLNVNFVKAAAEGNGKKKAHGKQQHSDEETLSLIKHIRREQEEKMTRVTSSRKRKSDESDTEDEACADNSSSKRDRKSVVRATRVVRRKTSSSSSSSSDDTPSAPAPTAVRRRREEAARWEPTRSQPTPDDIEKHKAIRILTNLTNDVRRMIREGATYFEIEQKLAVDFDRKSVGIRNRHKYRYGKDYVEHEYFSRPSAARNDLRRKIATFNKPSRREDAEQAERSEHWPAYYNSRGHYNNSNSRNSDSSSSSSKHGYRNMYYRSHYSE